MSKYPQILSNLFLIINFLGETFYHPWERYGSSKLANILFSSELNKRCAAEGIPVIAVSVNPGTIGGTNLYRHMGGSSALQLFTRICTDPAKMYSMMTAEPNKTIKQGKQKII